MKLTVKQLYDISKEQNLAVLAKDGLPFNSVIGRTPDPYPDGDVYFFCFDPDKTHYDEDLRIFMDFHEFYEICIPSICRGDLVAGECEIMEIDGVKFMGIDIYNKDLKRLLGVRKFQLDF